MAIQWFKRFREAAVLPYFNKAPGWKAPITAALADFKGLGFNVRFEPAGEEKDALVAFVLAPGPTKHPFPGGVAETKPDYKPDGLHGQTALQIDRRNTVYYAAIFLPGKLEKTTATQKQMVVLHELIHACGMDEHDSEGIMYDKFLADGTGVIEMVHDKNAKAMPPVRVGATTTSIMLTLWPPKKDSSKATP